MSIKSSPELSPLSLLSPIYTSKEMYHCYALIIFNQCVHILLLFFILHPLPTEASCLAALECIAIHVCALMSLKG